MSSEEKKIGLKVAYGYFQEGKWDRALEEYRKLERQDPADPNLRNMMAEIQVRRGAPQEALREYLECARLQVQARQHEKAISTCHRALRLEPGNPDALELQHASVRARLAEARALLEQGSLDAAHEAGQHLLDVDPTDLELHKLLDEVRAARLRQEASPAAEAAPPEAPAADPGREFVAKLFSLAESYLQAEDFDNAIESLVTILKFSPDEPAVRNRLQEVRDQLEKKRQAEEQWAHLQAEEARRLEETKRQQLEAEARSRWEREEAEARRRMESELSALQKSSASEQDIIQRAALEMRQKLMGGAEASAPGPAGLAEELAETLRRRFEQESQEREARFKAESEALREQLRREREGAEAAIREREAQMAQEAGLLKRQIEVARLEAEAKAREAAAREMARRMEEEQKENQARLIREREEMARREREFEERMQAALTAQQEVQQKAEAERREQRKQAIIAQALQRPQHPLAAVPQPGGAAARPSRRISETLKAAATKNIEHDQAALLASARAYLAQDLLQDAMRACQKVLEVDPENSDVKDLLREIFRKRGL